MIPLTVAKNGDGPTALFTGANHGDEYEGPIALNDLSNKVDIDKIEGHSHRANCRLFLNRTFTHV